MTNRAADSPPPLPLLKRIRFAIEYLIARTFAAYVRLWPRRLATWGGGIFGIIAGIFLRHDAAVARANLDLVFGDRLDRRSKRRMVRGSFRRVGSVLTGLFWSSRMSKSSAMDLVDGESFWSVLRQLEAQGRGAVLVTAHYGDWELLCLATAAAGLPVLMITEPLANPWLDRWFARMRSCTGNTTVTPMYAMLKLYRGLKRGQRVALMCDVNGRRGRGGVWVEFFGRQVFNGSALAELALRTRSPIVFAVTMPQPRGRYKVESFPPIEPDPTADRAQEVRRLTQQVVDLQAHVMRQNSAPWLWTYKRWKRKPSADASAYPFYARFLRVE